MSRRSLFIALGAILCAATARAGEIKWHLWPCAPIAQEIATIPVLMDIGYWIEIVNQDAVIKLRQITINNYEGCTDLRVRTNSQIRLSCSISPTGAVPGTYSCYITGADINPPGGNANVCAKLTNANLAGRPGGTKDLKVAVVTVRVVPRF
ncbi:MAG TPA: hypothetical protein VLI39_15095 [Sedimentisphaerales bacterium]|nr:hypothetical protein [Sedimentisphaerales bacterium]